MFSHLMKVYIIFMASCAVIFSGCQPPSQRSSLFHRSIDAQTQPLKFAISKIDILDVTTLSDSGAYYALQTPGYDQSINPANELTKLFGDGFEVTMAWYRRPLGGCSRPGSLSSNSVMYSPFLLVRLREPNERILRFEYKVFDLSKSYSFPCPYNITVYTPSDN